MDVFTTCRPTVSNNIMNWKKMWKEATVACFKGTIPALTLTDWRKSRKLKPG